MKKAIIILGAPGAGKGTQANLLAEKFDLFHVETGKIIRRKFLADFKPEGFVDIEGRRYHFAQEKQKYETGELMAPAFAFSLIKDAIQEAVASATGLVFSGSPRTMEEVQRMMPFLVELCDRENVRTFFLDLDVKTCVWRNSHRRVCELMEHSILHNEETTKLTTCPFDGSGLIKRALDVPETIKKRFQVFERDTLPIIDYIKDQGFYFQEIDGRPPVADVFANILKYL